MKLFLLLVVGVSFCMAEESEEKFAEKYLEQFNYMVTSFSGEKDMFTAVKTFQQRFDLPATGILDAPTLEVMHKPRCGVPDIRPNRAKRYDTYGQWAKHQLTYYFHNHGSDLDQGTVKSVIRQAFDHWAEVSSLRFSETSDSNADLKIFFGRYQHSTCYYPFDGPSGTLAHAFFPSDGRIHFDEDETFTDQTSEGINLLFVAVHEIGHALGLQHSYIHGSIMYPTYGGYQENLALHSDDIAGIQSLYPPSTNPDPNPQPTQAPVTQPPNPECTDRMNNCNSYVEANYCNIYRENMTYWCQKSCNFC